MDYGFRPGIHAIVYRKGKSGIEYLTLHRILNWTGWEFPKGGLKQGEDAKEVVVRELWEECGIDKNNILKINPLGQHLVINYPEAMWQKAGYRGARYETFAVEVKQDTKCTLENNADENEHDEIRWAVEGEVAKLVDSKLKESLALANKFITAQA